MLPAEVKAFLLVNESLDIQDIKSVYIEIEKDQQSLCKPVLLLIRLVMFPFYNYSYSIETETTKTLKHLENQFCCRRIDNH